MTRVTRDNPATAETPAMAHRLSAVLAELSSGDRVRAQEIADDVRRSMRIDADQLARVATDGDFPRLAQLAHRMRGSSSLLGANDLADVCRDLERAARLRNRRAIDHALPRFQREVKRLTDCLGEF